MTTDLTITKESQKLLWSNLYIVGTISKIIQGNGNLYILELCYNDSIYRVQCWGTAYIQIFNNEFAVGDTVYCYAWPSYYTNKYGKNAISLKTNALSKYGNLVHCYGTINSEWLKTKSLGKDVWQFTLKDINNNGNIIHCNVDKDSCAMRLIAKRTKVEVVGTFNMQLEEDFTSRMHIHVIHMNEWKDGDE